MPRLPVPPGLCCAACRDPFAGALARRTPDGYVHARPCRSPEVLDRGHWITVRGVSRWVGAPKPARPQGALVDGDRKVCVYSTA